MKSYDPSRIEQKWRRIWVDDKRYETTENSDKPKYYITNMFPYPSGAGMHVGHIFEYAIIDATTRFFRTQNYNVMYPMGFDNFGLPAENYAIKTGVSPQESIKANIAKFKHQLDKVGVSIDWSREVQTSNPEYYRWTQWIFTKFFERGLVYQKESLQWWCPVDKTVLANEQVEAGKCWRCGTEVVKKSMKQWFFKITEYADALLEGLDDLDWPEKIKTAQRNWIGKSVGAEIDYKLADNDEIITVFSTRPDTIFGATSLVLAPEHPLARSLAVGDHAEFTYQYIDEAVKKSEIERTNDTKEKTGVFTGSYAVNPATGENVPIWVADYVLGGYGTGAVMAVPAHDERDYAFAEKYDLPIVEVVEKPENNPDAGVYRGEGFLVNSGVYDGMESSDAREEIVAWLEQQGLGRAKTTYKMRDWLISRQRYWGAPIPIAYDKDGNAHAIPEDQLPVMLPEVENYEPDGSGKGVLARDKDFAKVVINGEEMTRETDTMDGYACSSWYLLRYTDPHNAEQAWDPEKASYWSPVDMYIGGDHAVAHLLYVRFWNRVFFDMGLVPEPEPVKKLVYHGLIQAEDGTKMSKSKGNVVDPIDVIDQGYGADALRTFELFLGPINENSSWNSRGIAGVYRFLNRVWTLTQEYLESQKVEGESKALQTLTHQTIKKVTDDYRRLSFNTAIAALMEYVNELYKLKTDGFSEQWQEVLETLVKLIQPTAPHMAAELWSQLGHDSQLDFEPWPNWDEALLVTETIKLVVQVNGKVRATVEIDKNASEEEVKALALAQENVQKFLENKEPTKVLYIPGRLVSIVVK